MLTTDGVRTHIQKEGPRSYRWTVLIDEVPKAFGYTSSRGWAERAVATAVASINEYIKEAG